MELILQQSLPHQQKAIDAVCNALNGVMITPPVQFFENPQINLADGTLFANLRALQHAVPAEYRTSAPIGSYLNLDIKMETGTGKTYVYTKTIYELHKRYGFNKFIIAVPSLPIKAGTTQFMQDDYARRHFPMAAAMTQRLNWAYLRPPRTKRKAAVTFPVWSAILSRAAARAARKSMCFW